MSSDSLPLDGPAESIDEAHTLPSVPPTRGPLKISYCSFCSFPHEYCEFSPFYEQKCKVWLEKNRPELILKSGVEKITIQDEKEENKNQNTESNQIQKEENPGKSSQQVSDEVKDDKGAEDEEDEESQSEEEEIKAKPVKSSATQVVISKSTRSKNKYITSIVGLDGFGVDLKKSVKLFSKKFACSASVVKVTGGQEIQVQGDIVMDLPEWIANEFKDKISKSVIYFVDKGGKKTKAF
jgi:density-regulated protein DRP1